MACFGPGHEGSGDLPPALQLHPQLGCACDLRPRDRLRCRRPVTHRAVRTAPILDLPDTLDQPRLWLEAWASRLESKAREWRKGTVKALVRRDRSTGFRTPVGDRVRPIIRHSHQTPRDKRLSPLASGALATLLQIHVLPPSAVAIPFNFNCTRSPMRIFTCRATGCSTVAW